MRKYAAKQDANHVEIKRYLEKLGAMVVDLSRAGDGIPDFLVGFRHIWILVEVKDGAKPPSASTLTKAQDRFHDSCANQAYLSTS